MIFRYTKKKFKGGDKVKLINEEQQMTVLSYEGGFVQCTWYSEEETMYKRTDVTEVNLVKANDH